MSELKPCPFCQVSATLCHKEGVYFVECNNGSCSMNPQTGSFADKETPVIAWNRRPIDSATADLRRQLEEARKDSARLNQLIRNAYYPGSESPWHIEMNDVCLAIGAAVEWENSDAALKTVREAIDRMPE